MKLLFLHGWQSTPGGVKPTYLKDHRHEVLNPALPDDDFDEAVRIAQTEYDRGRPDVVVGSSRGGAVAMNIEIEAPLVLLCPAWKRWGTARTVKPGTIILHSRTDETIPFKDSQELVSNSGLPESALIVVGHEHRLADPESLAKMLEMCEEIGDEDETPIGRGLPVDLGPAMDFGPIMGLISDCDDDDLLERVRAMASQLPGNPLARLADLPSYIAVLQAILDEREEKEFPQESTLDEMHETLQEFRRLVVEDLERARHDFELLRQQLEEKGKNEDALRAAEAIRQLVEMQRTQHVPTEELPRIDDLYGTLLSALVFDRP